MASRTLPLPAEADLSTATIVSDGKQVDDKYHVVSIVVTHEINRIPIARLVLLDGDPAKEDFPVSKLDEFAPGREVEILAGYHAKEESIFKGIVVRHAIRSRAEGGDMLSIVCKDPALKMAVARRSAYYSDAKDSDILDAILAKHGLQKDVEATALKHSKMVQYDATDWDFLVSRAEASGKLVFVRDGKVTIKAPDTSAAPVVTLVYGETITAIEAELDSEQQLAGIKTATWDHSTQDAVEVNGVDPGMKQQGNLSSSDLSDVLGIDDLRVHHAGYLKNQELQAMADSMLLRRQLARIRGRVRCQGFGGVQPGDVIELDGVGDRFNGNAYATAVRHEVTSGDWSTDIQIGLTHHCIEEERDFHGPLAAGTLPGIQGLHIGVVTQVGGDPDGEDRVKVRLPLVHAQDEGQWARVSTLDAGKKRGTFFRPEIDDEVVVGFFHGDPRCPVLLGMLNSSAKPAPLNASDKNPVKGYVSRSEIKLTIDDKKKILRIEMPSGRKITLDDDAGQILVEDKDHNSVKLNCDGIAIASGGDLKITAKGDVKLEGTNVELKASAEFKADGGSGSELTSSAVMTVKGSLVQIN